MTLASLARLLRSRRSGRSPMTPKRRGAGILSDLVGSLGLGRRRVRRRRTGGRLLRPRTAGVGVGDLGGRRRRRMRRGRGFLDVLKKVVGTALPFIKKSGIVGHALGFLPGVGGVASSAAKALGYGRRHRRSLRRVQGHRPRARGASRMLSMPGVTGLGLRRHHIMGRNIISM
jgi:hypothetical protein